MFPGNDDLPLTPGQVYGHAPRFNRRTGKQVHPGNGFYRARSEIGRPDFRFHDLRHFAATMAAISGATTKELMQFAGHSDLHVAIALELLDDGATRAVLGCGLHLECRVPEGAPGERRLGSVNHRP